MTSLFLLLTAAPGWAGDLPALPAADRRAYPVFHPYSDQERRETGMLIEVVTKPIGMPVARLATTYADEELTGLLRRAAEAITSGRRERYAPLLDWSSEEGLQFYWMLETRDWSGVKTPVLLFLTPLPKSTFAVFADADAPKTASLQVRRVKGELKSIMDGNGRIYSFLFSAIHGAEGAGRRLRPAPVPKDAVVLTPKPEPTEEIPGFTAEERLPPRLILPGHRLATIVPPPKNLTLDAGDDLPEGLTKALAFYSETLRAAAEGDFDGFERMLNAESQQRFRKKSASLPNDESRRATFAKFGRPREVVYAVPGPEVTILFTRPLDDDGVPTSQGGVGVSYLLDTKAGFRLTDIYASTSLERLLLADDGALMKELMRQVLDAP